VNFFLILTALTQVLTHLSFTDLEEVDPNGHNWARHLAEQERVAANSNESRIFTLYYENKDDLCDRLSLGRSQPCGGKTVIRSKPIEKGLSSHERLFIGCSNYQHREKGHTYRPLNNYDPVEILKIWGRERCYVHKDILDALGFSWDAYSKEGKIVSF
jgi:hypothetical protein